MKHTLCASLMNFGAAKKYGVTEQCCCKICKVRKKALSDSADPGDSMLPQLYLIRSVEKKLLDRVQKRL